MLVIKRTFRLINILKTGQEQTQLFNIYIQIII